MSEEKLKELDVSNLLPTNDYLFKRIFGRKGSERILESLLRNFVGIEGAEVESVTEDKILEKDLYTDKLGILDVQAKTKEEAYINVEMQCGNYEYINNRLVYYLCKMCSLESLKKGEGYNKMRKTVAVLICKDKLKMLKDIPKWKTIWHIREDEYSTKVLTDRIEVVIIELEKITKMTYEGKIEKDSKVSIWNKFFLNPKGLGGKEMEENKDVKEAKEKYEELVDDYAEAKLALSRQMYVMDMSTSEYVGYTKGLEEGEKKGKIEGKKETKTEIAKKMLEKKKSIEEIIELTELTKDEIENIEKSM